MQRSIARVAFGATLFFGLALGVAQGAAAQGGGAQESSLTIHHRLCGDNYKGGDPFVECHDYPVGTALDFTIDGPISNSGLTDAATGNLTFAVPAGTYVVSGGVPGEFSNAQVYCSDANTGDAVNVADAATGVSVEVPSGAAVVCDWYEFPENLRGDETPTPTTPVVTTTPKPVTQLPSTGAGAGNGVSDELMLAAGAAAVVGGLGIAARRRALR